MVEARRLSDDEVPRASAQLLELDQGLYALTIGPVRGASRSMGRLAVPAIEVSAPPSDELDPPEILACSGDSNSWLGADGGTVIVRSPRGGSYLLITTYGTPDQISAAPKIEINRLDRIAGNDAITLRAEREIPIEITLHIERLGDQQYRAQGWIGDRGSRLRIEAFGIRPLEALAPGDIEYMAFGPVGRQTPWVSEGKLCGTRGRGLPLTGFAVRLVPQLRDRFEVVYQGSFFAGGVSGPCRNGDPCNSLITDDPMEAINIRIIERPIR